MRVGRRRDLFAQDRHRCQRDGGDCAGRDRRGAPPGDRGDAGDEDRRGRPAQVSSEAVGGKRVAEARRRDTVVQDGEIGGMEDGVSGAREQRGGDERRISVRDADRDRREREEAQAGRERLLRAVAIDDESRERLADAGDDEEAGGQVKEVRRAVGKADDRHHPDIGASSRGGELHGSSVT